MLYTRTGEAATIFAIDPPLPDDDGVYITIRLTNGATRSTTAAHVTVVPAASTPKKPKVKAKSKSPRTRAKQSPGVLSGDEDDDDNGDDISSLTVAELKRRLAAAGQDATGKRIELVARLAKCTGVELDDSAAKKGRKTSDPVHPVVHADSNAAGDGIFSDVEEQARAKADQSRRRRHDHGVLDVDPDVSGALATVLAPIAGLAQLGWPAVAIILAVAYTADQPGSIIDLIAPVNGQIICLEKVLLLQCRNWRLVQRTLFIVGVWLAWAGIKQRPKMRTTDVMVTSPGVRGWLGYKEHKMVPMAGIWGQLGFKEKETKREAVTEQVMVASPGVMGYLGWKVPKDKVVMEHQSPLTVKIGANLTFAMAIWAYLEDLKDGSLPTLAWTVVTLVLPVTFRFIIMWSMAVDEVAKIKPKTKML